MPCLECENGKWRWGGSGECQYSSLESCESANADYYAEENDYDYTLNFTKEEMEILHSEGELLKHIEKEGKEMDILFTYTSDKLEDAYAKLTKSMLDDELDTYIERLTNSIKKL